MGDSGSMYLGFTLSGITLLGSREMASDIFFVLLVPAAMMGLPIFDTTLVTIMRTLEGRPLSQGGRDHLSHRLVAVGLSERQSVLVLYVLAACFGSLGLVARIAGVWLSLLLAGVYLAIAVLFGAFLAQVRMYNPVQFAEQSERLRNRPVVNGMIMFKRELGEAALDFVLVCVAYLGAFVLHYGFPESGRARTRSVRGDAGHAVRVAGVGAAGQDAPAAGVPGVPRDVALSRHLRPDDACQSHVAQQRHPGHRSAHRGARRDHPAVGAGDRLPAVHVPAARLARVCSPRSTTPSCDSRAAGSRACSSSAPATSASWCCARSCARGRPRIDAIGFLDPDPATRNRTVHSVRVLGTTDDLASVADSTTSTWWCWRWRRSTPIWPNVLRSAARRWVCPRWPRRRSCRCTSPDCRCCPHRTSSRSSLVEPGGTPTR